MTLDALLKLRTLAGESYVSSTRLAFTGAAAILVVAAGIAWRTPARTPAASQVPG